jgi:protein O-mannosyl-transferase
MAKVPEVQSVPGRSSLASQLERPWLALIFVAAVTFVLYHGTLSFEFVWDDSDQIINNPLIRSWHSVSRVFLSDLWFHTLHNQLYYRPLFIVWEILNFKLFGLTPWGWHLTTVLLHVLASCIIYWLARALKLDHWTAALAALVFGIHPIHLECASWISAASDSMVTILYTLAFIFYVKSRNRHYVQRRYWQVLSFVLLGCALLTKEMAITFAMVVVVYEFLDRKALGEDLLRRLRQALVSAAPYAVLTLGYFLLRRIALHQSNVFDPAYTNLDVLLTLPAVLFTYMRLLVIPKGITAAYFVPYVSSPGFRNFLLPLLALLAVTAIVGYWSWRRKDTKIVFLAAWLLLGLTPVLYLRLFAAGAGVRDRYIYLPSAGFAILLAIAIRSIRLRGQNNQSLHLAAASALSILLFAGSLLQQVYWASDLLVFYRAYSLYPQNQDVAINLSDTLVKKHEYGRAIPILRQVVQAHPDSGTPHQVLALAYLRLGEPLEARNELAEALRIAPELLYAPKSATDVANLYGELGDYQKAITLYKRVLQQEPDLYDALYNGGYTYFLIKDDDEAEKLFLRAAQVAPGLDPAAFYLGRIYLRKAQPDVAEAYFRRALDINPEGYGLHYWLGQALAARGQSIQARKEYTEELRLHPKNPDAIAQMSISSTSLEPRGAKQ